MNPDSQNIPPRGSSGVAVASCVMAGVTLMLMAIQMMAMVMGRASAGGQPTTGDWMLGFAMLGSLCGGGLSGIVGIVLGAIAMFMPNRPRRLALIGLIANVVLLVLLWMVVAMSG